MTRQSWILTDTDKGVYLPQLALGPADFTGEQVRGLRVTKSILRGGVSDAVDVLDLENGALRIRLLPTRGMGIHRVWCGDVELGWRSPVAGPVHPQLVNLFEPSGIGWLSGFDEWLCRCGLESNGAQNGTNQDDSYTRCTDASPTCRRGVSWSPWMGKQAR